MKDRFDIFQAVDDTHMESARLLFREYQEWLNVDLCFQDFEAELQTLPGNYAPPMGRLYLVVDRKTSERVACVALRPQGEGRCEMKRLYVRKSWRGCGLGRFLAELCLTEAHSIGYDQMCLDTISHLTEARSLYKSMGFMETAPYYDNPLENVVYMQREIGKVGM